VHEAVVIARTAPSGEAELAAYVTGDGTPNVEALRRDLAAHLPEVMVPRHILALDAFPLTPNKKIDRNALPDPQAAKPRANTAMAAPAKGAAAEVARIVEEDIRFLNQLRASHDSTIENTRHEEVEIPEMPDLPYSTWLEYAPNFDIPTLQSEFDARLAELDALDDSGIDDIAVKTREAIDSHQDLGKSLLNELWLAVNHYAREHWVEESSLEEEIERLESNYGRTDVAL